ncbi:hypothetical protein AC062_1386 [Pasteurellaceae bacterium NI1060]|nr:hypothetical protein AC062_1386 [Pasteurellaceae bacterium NI1060]
MPFLCSLSEDVVLIKFPYIFVNQMNEIMLKECHQLATSKIQKCDQVQKI